ncbi:MAG: capsular biosynthesis protein, partial [Chloroflexi bacterium]|nr:capsular biosynthesis protein [Chloroflexota bacterium]
TYDWILIDVPPVQAVSDSQLLVSRVDGILLVVQAGRVSEDVAKRTVHRLTTAGGNIVGIILNRYEHVDSEEYALYNYYRESESKDSFK